MYQKRLSLLLAAVMVCAVVLTGCGKPSLPALNLDESTLEGSVEYVTDRTCLIRVTAEDDHYDEDDLVYVTASKVSGADAVEAGDTVSVTYHYTTDVSEYNGEPHITVKEVSVRD